MNAVLFLSLILILGAALWPKSSFGRSQHRPRDKQPPAYEAKVLDHEALQKAAVKLKALDIRSTPETSQNSAVQPETPRKATGLYERPGASAIRYG